MLNVARIEAIMRQIDEQYVMNGENGFTGYKNAVRQVLSSTTEFRAGQTIDDIRKKNIVRMKQLEAEESI